jgi:hypothetical protein
MRKTVCELKYQTFYLSSNKTYLAHFEYEFMGDNSEHYQNRLNYDVCFAFNEINDQTRHIRNKANTLYVEYDGIADDRSLWQKLLRKKDTPNWKRKAEIENKLDEYDKLLIDLHDEYDRVCQNLIKDVHAALRLHGFLITSHNVNDNAHYEIWTREV